MQARFGEVGVAEAAATNLAAAAGLVLFVDPAGGPAAVRPRAARRRPADQSLSHLSPDDAEAVRGAHLLPGADVVVEGQLAVSPTLALALGAGAEIAFGRTDVFVHQEKVAEIAPLRLVADGGLVARFWPRGCLLLAVGRGTLRGTWHECAQAEVGHRPARDAESAGPPTPPPIDDIQLLAALRAADPGAAEALYERSRPIVARTLNRLLGRDDPEHQDLSQQTMVEIVRTIDRYRGECPLDAWIATLAAHVVYKHIRHRKVERRVLSDVLPFEPVAADQPAHRAALRSTIDRVCGHLAEHRSGRAWAFLLHDVHGHDLREVAQILSISPAAAQSRLVRGRKDLHARVAADPELAAELERTEGRG